MLPHQPIALNEDYAAEHQNRGGQTDCHSRTDSGVLSGPMSTPLLPRIGAMCLAALESGAAVTVGLAASILVLSATGTSANDTLDNCQCASDDGGCPPEVPLSELNKATKGQIKTITNELGHPHEHKDGSFEDMYISKKGCVCVGNKDGTGIGRLVGRI